ncbi:heparinase II/III family protein [Piscinibacter terrae]|nr:heparinase II/III family protein [Albitalea terrae]
MPGARTMRFLSVERTLDDGGWDNPAVPLLWRYNLHYFDDLNAQGAAQRAAWHHALIDDWLSANPAGSGTAWAPYPTSLRIVNWIKWFQSLPDGGEIPGRWINSLATQGRWLAGRLEWHLLGNHLFANAKALVHAGLFFEGDEARRWLEKGLHILEREIPEQILLDGGHFERSPMYHALAVEDMLDLVNIVRRYPQALKEPARWSHLASAMLAWLFDMSHPDGTLARFNDTAPGIAPSTPELVRMAVELDVPVFRPGTGNRSVQLPQSGYARLGGNDAVLLADVAPIGPDYLPGHAHADTLSYELSAAGRQLVVNRGTSEYGTGARRQLERSTSAHSTVEVHGQNSSEVWAGFRVGRRARAFDVQWSPTTLEGSHDGYRFLPGRPIHHRRWQINARSLLVEDRLSPSTDAVSRHHLAPGLTLHPQTPSAWLVMDGPDIVARADILVGSARAEPWQHAEGFGRLAAAETLVITLQEGQAALRWHW